MNKIPDPVVSVDLVTGPLDRELLEKGLKELAKQDESFRAEFDAERGCTTVSGMGELHLDIILDRLKRVFGVRYEASKPRVAYRETIRATVTDTSSFDRSKGGSRSFATCTVRVEPLKRGAGVAFESITKKEHVPPDYLPGIEQSVRDVCRQGVITPGQPLVDLKVTLINGSTQGTANAVAFKVAAALSARMACKKAKPVVLEPIMKLEVVTVRQHLRDVIADLNHRRAAFVETGDREGFCFARVTIPVATMFGYADWLRSVTLGRGSFTTEPSRWDEVAWSTYKGDVDPRSPDEPPTASAGRPVKPIRPKPGRSGGERRPLPPKDGE